MRHSLPTLPSFLPGQGKQALLILPILLIILTSGCTMPGGFCIPGLTCGATVEETHDVIVIESLQALPNNVPPGGTIQLVAIVSNKADMNAEIKTIDEVQVELYDYCSGLFEVTGDLKKTEENFLRGEKRQVEWTLKAKPKSQVPVKTECNLRILARYKYSTTSITTLHLIDYTEMQRRINEGTYSEVGSYISVGYGPIKPYIRVEGTQPIPVTDDEIGTTLSFQIINRGNGFLSAQNGEVPATGAAITKENNGIKISGLDTFTENVAKKINECNKIIPKEGLKLIKGESTKIPCTLQGNFGKVPVESTKTLKAEVNDYYYEFRDSIKVTVEPTF